MGATDEAAELYNRAIEYREKALTEENAEDSRAWLQLQLAQSLASAANGSTSLTNQSPEQLQVDRQRCQRALAIMETVRAELDSASLVKLMEVKYQANQVAAKLAERSGDEAAVIENYRASLATLNEWAELQPGLFRTKRLLLNTEEELGDYFLKNNQPSNARKEYIALLLQLHNLQNDEDLQALNKSWAMAYYRLGLAAVQEHNEERRQKYFGRVAEIYQARLKQREEIEGKSDPSVCGDDRDSMMLAQAWAGQTDSAASAARRSISKFTSDTSENAPYRLATAAIALGIAAQYVPADRQPAAASEALEALKLAINSATRI